MPGKKKKFNARFPPARIKKIMQTDEDVGKVAATVPVVISRALELFIESLVMKSYEVTQSKNAKTLSAQHLKHVILSEQKFDFLKDQVAAIPDVQNAEEDNGERVVTTSTPKAAADIRKKHRSKVAASTQPSTSESKTPEPTKRPRGRPRKPKPEVDAPVVKKKRGRKPKSQTESATSSTTTADETTPKEDSEVTSVPVESSDTNKEDLKLNTPHHPSEDCETALDLSKPKAAETKTVSDASGNVVKTAPSIKHSIKDMLANRCNKEAKAAHTQLPQTPHTLPSFTPHMHSGTIPSMERHLYGGRLPIFSGLPHPAQNFPFAPMTSDGSVAQPHPMTLPSTTIGSYHMPVQTMHPLSPIGYAAGPSMTMTHHVPIPSSSLKVPPQFKAQQQYSQEDNYDS